MIQLFAVLALLASIFVATVGPLTGRYEMIKYENALKLDPAHGVLSYNTCRDRHDTSDECDDLIEFVGVDESSEYYARASGWWRLP